MPVTWSCAACGQANESAADPSQGRRQRYVEDCQVCCRPNLLELNVDVDGATAVATLEDG